MHLVSCCCFIPFDTSSIFFIPSSSFTFVQRLVEFDSVHTRDIAMQELRSSKISYQTVSLAVFHGNKNVSVASSRSNANRVKNEKGELLLCGFPSFRK